MIAFVFVQVLFGSSLQTRQFCTKTFLPVFLLLNLPEARFPWRRPVMVSHSDDSAEKVEKVEKLSKHDAFAHHGAAILENEVSHKGNPGVGTAKTPSSFDHIDERKILWKVPSARVRIGPCTV